MTTLGSLEGACAAMVAPDRLTWPESAISVSDSPTISYSCVIRNRHKEDGLSIPAGMDSIYDAGGRGGAEVTEMGMLSEDAAC